MELIEMEQRPMTQDKMRQLADKVSESAYESAESFWSTVLDVVDMDTAQYFEQALAALLELRNYDKAMGMVTGLFALWRGGDHRRDRCLPEIPRPHADVPGGVFDGNGRIPE